ncbi:MAG: hypothetical protein ABIR19_02715, partial [Ginsengibacter sp.]
MTVVFNSWCPFINISSSGYEYLGELVSNLSKGRPHDIFVFLCPAGNSKNDYPPNVKVVPIKNDKGLTAKWLFIHQAK